MSPFAEVLSTAGVAETYELRSDVGVMAYHGGSLEVMTDVIAAEVAERAGASYYAVIQPQASREHFPSISVRPSESDRLAAFLDHVDVVITIHGFGRRGMFSSLLLGGRNRVLAAHVGARLRTRLPAYDIVTELTDIPEPLRGQHAANPVNLPRNGGVQIELPPRVRGLSPMWWDWEGPGLTPHTEALIDGLVDAVTTWGSGI
jgi:phage replication-related protein YjqB (UPF0714/DUF867 family)